MWFLIAGLAAVFLAHAAPFPFALEAFAPSRSLWRVEPRGGARVVYLTYDDGPNPAATPALLDVLRDGRARATFFLIDAHVTEETAPVVRRMFAEGHGVGLHSDSRRLMLETPAVLAARLRAAADRIERLTGSAPCRLFRPHAGWRSGSMYEGLERIDYRLVGWSWGLWDIGRRRNAAHLAGYLAGRASPGDIVVMHDGHHSDPRADRRYAVDATQELIAAMGRRGFAFEPLCESDADETAEAAAAGTEPVAGRVVRPRHA